MDGTEEAKILNPETFTHIEETLSDGIKINTSVPFVHVSQPNANKHPSN